MKGFKLRPVRMGNATVGFVKQGAAVHLPSDYHESCPTAVRRRDKTVCHLPRHTMR